MSGTRTAETSKNGQNAEEVPGKVVSPALEQQKAHKSVRMLNQCWRWQYLRGFDTLLPSKTDNFPFRGAV